MTRWDVFIFFIINKHIKRLIWIDLTEGWLYNKMLTFIYYESVSSWGIEIIFLTTCWFHDKHMSFIDYNSQ